MQIYRILSALMSYPQPDLIAALPEIHAELAADPEVLETLQPLLSYLQDNSLISVQETMWARLTVPHRLPCICLNTSMEKAVIVVRQWWI